MRFVGVALIALVAVASVRGADAASRGAMCFGKPATIIRGSGDDEINGTGGVDVIVAGGGNDYVAGKEGDDYICGGDGDDELHGGNDTDHTDGGGGDDFVDGRRGVDDILLGGNGRDRMLGGGEMAGGPGPDKIDSYSYEPEVAVDKLRGGDGNDVIRGDGRNGFGERLLGGRGDDLLVGEGGEDVIKGGSGSDRLNGKSGDDKLDGGPQIDSCRPDPADEIVNCENDPRLQMQVGVS